MIEGTIEVTVLVEDSVRQRGLAGEHGLSFLIELPKHTILFDLGQTDLFIKNAKALHRHLEKVKSIVLSHGHYDHGGGLPYLQNLVQGFTLYLHPDSLQRKYVNRGVHREEIGLNWTEQTVKEMGGAIKFVTEAQKLPFGGLLTGEIIRNLPGDEQLVGETDYGPDRLCDDQALVLPTPQGSIIVVGCSHAGLLNTLEQAKRITKDKRIRAVIGGFHLLHADDQKITATLERIRELDVGLWGPCHCTGVRAQVSLLQAFPQRVRCLTTGSRLMFEGR